MTMLRNIILTSVLGVSAAGCQAEAPVETLCDPGSHIFCRCEDGSAGTKTCDADGQGTGECGNCAEPPVTFTSPSQPAPPDPNVTHAETPADFLAPCTLPTDCASSMCVSGYCTKPCSKVSECEFGTSECVPFEGQSVCMPKCSAASDCTKFGAVSQCGYGFAVDNWRVTACANWAGQHQLKPVGSDCLPLDHKACNLGYTGRQTVCTAAGKCEKGCFFDSDCPANAKCSAQGSLGACQ